MLHSNQPGQDWAINRRVTTKGFVIAVLGLALVGGLIWYFLTRPSAPGNGEFGGGRNGRNATSVGVAIAEKRDIPVLLNALGTVTAIATVTLRPQVSGVLQEVHYREGQMVKAGELLASIDPRQFELALQQASGQRQRDEAQLQNAQLVLKRDLVLQAQDSIAQQDVEAQSALVKQLQGTVMTDRAQEGNARLNLSYTKVTAPISGRVGLRAADVGNVVSPGDANGIAVITQLAPIDVEFSVPQTQVGDIQAELGFYKENNGSGNKSSAKPEPIKVSAFDRNRTTSLAEGQFLALDNQVDVQTGTVRAKARFANDDKHLFPNQFVNVTLVLRTIKDAIVIPIAALRHSDSGDFIFVLNAQDHTVALRNVTAGQADVDKVQIITGLALGEKVITEGADHLKDGATVKLPGDHPGNNMSDKKGGDKGEVSSSQTSSAAGEHRRKRRTDES